MHNTHTEDKAKDIAKQALEAIQTHDLPMYPAIFEVWYTYFSQENPELSHAVDLMTTKAKDGVTTENCINIYTKYLDSEEQVANVREAGTQMQSSIKDINTLVIDVQQTTTSYNNKLTDLSSELKTSGGSSKKTQQLVESVVSDTQVILQKNKQLEVQLEQQAQMMVGLQRDLDRVKQEALTDGLTNVANRKAFDQQILKMVDYCTEEPDHTFSLILMDIDHFKSFNDNYGHQVGDQVLRLVARTLIDGIKGRDFVARYGGEEFAIILPGTNQHAARKVADELREAVANKQVVNKSTGKKLGRITLSGGLTEYFAGDNHDDIIARADQGLYEAKDQGRNRICMAKIQLVRA